MIKQNIFEISSESRVPENEHTAGKTQCVFLIYRDKVRHPSTAKLQTQVWKKATCKPPSHDRDINDLQHRIIEPIDTVTVDILARTWKEIEYRLGIVRATDGAYVEEY